MEAQNPLLSVQQNLRKGLESRPNVNPLLLPYGEMLIDQGPPTFFLNWSEDALSQFVESRFAFAESRVSRPFSLGISEAPNKFGKGISPYSVIEIIVDDRPFLIDSIQSYLARAGIDLHAILHPIIHVKRNGKGVMKAVQPFTPRDVNEAHLYFIVSLIQPGQRQGLLEELRASMYDLVRSVDDYPAVKKRLSAMQMDASKGGADSKPVSGLLKWFGDKNFVFMGVLPFQSSKAGLVPKLKDGLGLFHPEQNTESDHETLIAQATRFINAAPAEEPFLVVEETSVLSRMHNRVAISLVMVSPRGRKEGSEPVAVAGIFSNRSLRADFREIPVVSEKIVQVVERHQIVPDSYKHKELLDFFNGLPRFELFRLSATVLEWMSDFFLTVVDQPRVEVAQMMDPDARTLRILATLPGQSPRRETLRQIRERVEAMFNLTAQNQFTLTVSNFSVLQFVLGVSSEREMHLPDHSQIEAVIREELLTPDERLIRLWLNARGPDLDEHLARSLVMGLPEDYKLVHGEMEIFSDLAHLEELIASGKPQFALRHAHGGEGMRLVLYGLEKLSLSRLMPIFNNLRVLVEEEETFEVQLSNRPGYAHTFLLHPPEGVVIEPSRHQGTMRDLIFKILSFNAENDPLNALILYADFDWRGVALMQLYRNYLMQVGTVYTRRTINETLIRRFKQARALFNNFQVRFDPNLEGREKAIREADEALADAVREIDNLTEDRIFKSLGNLVQATLRTNFYRDSEDPVVAVKLESAAIDQLPTPRPLYEIVVFSSLMEGIHLRGDMIARGGIRYSDRPDDFRTEVLGLMHTQMKKNALIVPLGSKGGFVVKNLAPFDGNARTAGDDRYRAFIGALLSVTDNLVKGQPVPPPDVVRRDGDDPYLVVAADKGTAHLSDTANEVSQQQGFWLSDAFASGGSNGYDHKIVGITARGAWESVKRLFWEKGVDIQSEPVTVAGVGDMSGDVFGNGMLLSRCLKVVGAFDHRHIFLDPDPDPEISFVERERLFNLPRSAWSDYNSDLISEGGGVFPRNAKEIALAPRLREMLGVEAESLSGEEMIRALLSTEVDLIWNGGIGTYVKSSGETHPDVGDPNNDAVRIDAPQFRAKVVGEGGNLGFTQSARIDIDLGGGSIHTDAIDNAGGVNMSDQEVNLKILLGALMDAGAIPDQEARNRLLNELEDSVTETVIRANFRQVMMISMDRLRSKDNVEPFIRLVDMLAREAGMDRRTEAIPNHQRLRQNHAEGKGMPRPVLAVQLAYTKMSLYKRLIQSDLIDEPSMDRYYRSYFPQRLHEDFDLGEVRHPLRREIIATVATNIVVDQAGMAFVPETANYAGVSWPEVVRAYLQADTMVNGGAFREQIYAQVTRLPAETQYQLLTALEDLLAEMVRWLLFQPSEGEGNEAAQAQEELFADYCGNIGSLIDDAEKTEMTSHFKELLKQGLETEAAQLASQMRFLRGFPLVCGLALDGGLPLGESFALAREAEGQFRFGQLEEALSRLQPSDPMQKRFSDGLVRSLNRQRQTKMAAILAASEAGSDPADRVRAYLEANRVAWESYQSTVGQVLAVEQPEAVALAVAVEQLEAL